MPNLNVGDLLSLEASFYTAREDDDDERDGRQERSPAQRNQGDLAQGGGGGGLPQHSSSSKVGSSTSSMRCIEIKLRALVDSNNEESTSNGSKGEYCEQVSAVMAAALDGEERKLLSGGQRGSDSR